MNVYIVFYGYRDADFVEELKNIFWSFKQAKDMIDKKIKESEFTDWEWNEEFNQWRRDRCNDNLSCYHEAWRIQKFPIEKVA